MADSQSATGKLAHESANGEAAALEGLLRHYRVGLRRFADRRLDPRVSARFDPSDIVQDVLGAAADRIPGWLDDGKPLSACLYRLMRDRIARVCRDHIGAAKRSVVREVRVTQAGLEDHPDGLLGRCAAPGHSPSQCVQRREAEERVSEALTRLSDFDRQVVTLRILEGLSARATAESLGLSEHAVHMRQLRALRQLRSWLGES